MKPSHLKTSRIVSKGWGDIPIVPAPDHLPGLICPLNVHGIQPVYSHFHPLNPAGSRVYFTCLQRLVLVIDHQSITPIQ